MGHRPSEDKTGLNGPRLLVGFSLLVLVIMSSQSAMPAEPNTLCWRDYPIPTDAVNYEKAFVSGTLAPDLILFKGKALKPSMTESSLNGILGSTPAVIEDWRKRTVQEQCEYLLEVLREHPNSMHLYKLGELKLKKMSGLFRVSEWRLPDVGTLRAFFHKPSAEAAESSYLYHQTLLPVPPDNVKRKKGTSYVLTRPGAAGVEWNINLNRISINSHANGKE
jgi:hypothetical protein